MKTYRRFYAAGISNYHGKPMRRVLPAAAAAAAAAALFFCFFASDVVIMAQDKKAAASGADNPVSETTRRFYAGMKNILLLSAEKVPEENYSFKATDEVRSYAQIIAHIADSQYEMCSIALGEKDPAANIEKTKTSKADLIAALKGAFAYCDRAYNGMTDASAGQMVKFMGSDTTKLGVLTANLVHSGLHYGNLITYMRMKKIVPPTSEPDFFKPPEK